MDLDISGKVVIITGSTLPKGIGKGIALKFAEEGAKVVLVGRNSDRGNEALDNVLKLGAEAIFVRADVGNEDDVKNLVSKTIERFGRIDVLINNAASHMKKRILDLTGEELEDAFRTNVYGVFYTIKHVAPHMMKQGGGSIINISSIGGVRGGAYEAGAAYCSSKAAQIQLTRVAALDFGRYNIRVNCILPGGIASPELEDPKYRGKADMKEFYQRFAEKRPLGRCGVPEDVAYACMFLASEYARFITGAVLYVDGGVMAGRYPSLLFIETSSYPEPPPVVPFPSNTLFEYT